MPMANRCAITNTNTTTTTTTTNTTIITTTASVWFETREQFIYIIPVISSVQCFPL